MMGRIVKLTISVCITVFGIVDEWPMLSIVLSAAVDLWLLVEMISAASRGES